jgi:crotonobetainyl-CoA:carnitine CoA-transferase CaiB-like acyl-CoA transferase
VALLTYQAGIYFATGKSPTRTGNRHPTIVPYETFRCKDGYLNLGCGNDSLWRSFCEEAGLQALTEDARYRSNRDRVENADDLRAVLEPVLKQKTVAEWIKALRARGIPSGSIQSVKEVCEHPQTLAREMVVGLQHPKAGAIRVTGVPIKLSDTPGAVDRPPPVLGEHTTEVLREWLNMSEVQVNKLREAGVL